MPKNQTAYINFIFSIAPLAVISIYFIKKYITEIIDETFKITSEELADFLNKNNFYSIIAVSTIEDALVFYKDLINQKHLLERRLDNPYKYRSTFKTMLKDCKSLSLINNLVQITENELLEKSSIQYPSYMIKKKMFKIKNGY